MKFTVEIDTEVDSPIAVGGALLGKFWDESPTPVHPWGRRGCYSSFEYLPEVQELPDEIETWKSTWGGAEYEEKITWHSAKWNEIVCRWYWDGDGYVEFIFPDGSVLHNGDIKNDDDWAWRKDEIYIQAVLQSMASGVCLDAERLCVL